ncbi:MAG: 3'-5' exoribonuclease [Pleurocapsa sp. MO_226.B13]|nr:3'-5' exoribonuclease [Pleurocapsa sp. MO_226.B13]
MKFFLDTEFIEDGKTIDLISIGIVSDANHKYYACNSDCDLSKANNWVKENVINQLPPKKEPSGIRGARVYTEHLAWRSQEQIAVEVVRFVKTKCVDLSHLSNTEYANLVNNKTLLWELELDSKPEFWGYYADYDWVVFCQLFGTMMDLPTGFPMYCKDLKQECDRYGNPRLPKQKHGKHNAVEDAKWNRYIYHYLQNFQKR